MNLEVKQDFLNEAIQIGQEINRRGIETDEKIFWKTQSYHKDGYIWKEDSTIYSGVAGIIIFYLELYKLTEQARYKEIIEKAANWLLEVSDNDDQLHGSYYSGKTGIAITLIRVHEIVYDDKYIKGAIRILKSEFRDIKVDDLLNGVAGTILGLLQAHVLLQEDFLLQKIDKYLGVLLRRVYLSQEGIYWDRSNNIIKGLCGFSHGAAGMAFIFLEIGKYFDNDAYFWLAKETMKYENGLYNKNINNWPDFRKGIYSQEDEIRFRKKFFGEDYDFFTQYGDFSAWCHGATGIGLSRLRAYDIFKSETFKKDIETAYKKTLENSFSSYTLCHGHGGDALFYSELHNHLQDNIYQKMATETMTKAIQQRQKSGRYGDGLHNSRLNQDDLSLFNGIAGIGYAFIKVTNNKVPNILFPYLENTFDDVEKIGDFENLSVDLKSLKNRIIKVFFPLTTKCLEKKNTDYRDAPLNKNIIEYLENLKNCKNILETEKSKISLEFSTKSWAMLSFTQKIAIENIRKFYDMSDSEFIKAKLQLNSWSILGETKDLGGEKAPDNSIKYYIVYINHQSLRAEHLYISEFEYSVLKCFERTSIVSDGFNIIKENYEIDSVTKADELKNVYVQIVRKAINLSFLSCVGSTSQSNE